MTNHITSFTADYRWLSNFWPAVVSYEGMEYPTVEHAYVASKTTDEAIRALIRRCTTAGEAKRYGRSLQLRSDWESIKVKVMLGLLRQKFTRPDLKTRLLNTGDAELIEGNTWGDTFWGVCEGEGQNTLGKLLMLVRSGWILFDERFPPNETPVLVIYKGEQRILEIRWEHPTYEETFKAFRYLDDPENDGQDIDWLDATHWRPLPDDPPWTGYRLASDTLASAARRSATD